MKLADLWEFNPQSGKYDKVVILNHASLNALMVKWRNSGDPVLVGRVRYVINTTLVFNCDSSVIRALQEYRFAEAADPTGEGKDVDRIRHVPKEHWKAF